MGFYINPTNDSKESWLARFAMQVSRHEFLDNIPAKGGYVGVCLVDNMAFTAAAVAYSKAEAAAFVDPSDNRPKQFYIVKTTDLLHANGMDNVEYESMLRYLV